MTKFLQFIFLIMLCGVMPTLGQAATNLDSLRAVADQSQDSVVRFDALMMLGDHFTVSDFDSAEHYINRADQLASAMKNPVHKIRALLSMAQNHVNASNYEKSIDLFFRAMRVSEKHNESRLYSTASNGIGINYYYMGDHEKSARYIRESAEILRDAEFFKEYAIALSNLSGLYTIMGKTEEALQMLKEATGLLHREDQPQALMQVYNILGTTHRMHTGNYDSAAYYYRQYLDLSEARNNAEGIMVGTFNLGELLFIQKKYSESKEHILRALRFSLDLQRDAYRLGIYNTLSELYSSTGEDATALRYKNHAYHLNDSIFKRETQQALSELELKYETEKKERQIKAQQAQIQTQNLENERNRRRQNAMMFGAILLLIVGSFVVIWIYNRKASRKRHESEKSAIYENIAHEIKTPLTLITAPVQELIRQSPAVIRPELELIKNNTDRLAELVNELLDLNQTQRASYPIREESGNPIELIEQLVNDFRLGYAESNQHIELDVHPENQAGQFHYPADALTKIFNNLLGNALKYSPNGSEVLVSANIENNVLYLTVKDNGPGIPKKYHQKVFRRFFRINHKDRAGGKGIGLYLVNDLVKQLNGRITLNSELNKGTCFDVEIPLRKVDGQIPVLDSDDDRPLLLVVEDNNELARFVSGMFQEHFRVITQPDGKSGIASAKSELPDIILTDIMMPEADGIELLRSVKEDPVSQHIPVVVFSAKSALESRLEGLQYGADAYIAKPFDTEELRLTVRNLLQTIRNAQKEYREKISSEKPFNERVRSSHEYLNKLTACIVNQIDNSEYSVNELASDMHISRSQLHRKIQSLSGLNTTQFIRMIRLEYAKDLLLQRNQTIAEIAYRCGFSSPNYFTSSFSKYTGMSPKAWLDQKTV